MAHFDFSRMPLGHFMWTLVVLAFIGAFTIIGVTGWLLLLFITQHVRVV